MNETYMPQNIFLDSRTSDQVGIGVAKPATVYFGIMSTTPLTTLLRCRSGH